jgi:Rod binding domain-containing protein
MHPVSAQGTPGAQTSIAPQPRLVRAAHEFEAQMMKELLKPMTGKDALTGEEDGSSGGAGSNNALGEFASEALGKALSQRGGFGIASTIVHELSHSGNRHGSGKVTGIPHDDTVIRTSKSLK